jgi:hypothetical protein
MLLFDYNQKHDDQIVLRDEAHDGVEIAYLTNDKLFPPGFRPAYAVKDGYLVVAGSPDAVRRFAAPSRVEGTPGEATFLRISGSALREYLRAHRSELGKWIASAQDKPADEVVRDLGYVTDLLEPIDRVELVARGDERRLNLAVRVRLVKPLSK